MYNKQHSLWLAAMLVGLVGCDGAVSEQGSQPQDIHGTSVEADPPKGPHGGRLLIDDDFALELAIFETGIPPEFRLWITDAGTPIAPGEVEVHVTLTRLGNQIDEIAFAPQDDFLRGDSVIYEPHSFVVTIQAQHRGTTHRWRYDNFEGRTRIGSGIAEAFGLETEITGPATILETVTVYGRVVPHPEQVRAVSARFDGVIQSVKVSIGDTVRQGQTLATIESNESLESYSITAPIAGIVTERAGNPGEQTSGRLLFTIMDTTTVWAEFAVFPSARARVRSGATVTVSTVDGDVRRHGVVARFNSITAANQSILAIVVLENPDGALIPGMYMTGEILVAEHPVPLAVKRTGLQSFRDFMVVYAQIGEEYEVRMLELGRQDAQWVEVIAGIDPGIRYVTTNSYLIKADIEKSGASHDH